MFGIGRADKGVNNVNDASGTPPASTPEAKGGGKGRPTPTRREAERRNQRPLLGPAVSPKATKAERQAARKARREATNAQRALQRQAMMTGDEKNLPPRDRGPARRWVRDYVDARRGLGEYFLGFALLALVLSMVSNPVVQLTATVLLWTVMISVAVESFLLRRRLKRETQERFGDKAHGAAGYGMARALQVRRMRLPRPQVQRGQFPT